MEDHAKVFESISKVTSPTEVTEQETTLEIWDQGSQSGDSLLEESYISLLQQQSCAELMRIRTKVVTVGGRGEEDRKDIYN